MMHVRQTASLALVVFAGWIGSALPASAQTAAPYNQAAEALTIEPAPVVTNRVPWTRLFTDTIRDFRRMPSRDTAQWLTIGALAAVATHPADTDVSRSLSRSRELHE